MSAPGPAGQRRRPKRFEFTPETCPNFDFACWLREWYEEAASKDLRIQFAYRKALEAMVRWPEKLRSGKEAEKLPGIGPSISGKLSERMMLGGGFGWIGGSDADRIIDLHPEPERPTKSKKTLSVADPQASEPKTSKATTAKSRKAASYVPSYRSGPYAILIALLLHLERLPKDSAAALSLGKNELQLAAQPLCTASLSEGSGIAFSAISGALKILENKKLLVRTLLPPQFSLTKQGLALARKLYDAGEQASRGPLDATNLDQLMDSLPDLEGDEAPEETRPEKESVLGNAARGDAEPVPFTWPVGSFEVVLLVDVREIRSREDRNYLTDRLRQLGVPCELRNLELGDFLWVARRKGSEKYEEGRKGSDALATEEIVLDTLIERKREDDLAASILDGRFKEQKHRIRRSLLRSCFYIVERNGNASAAGGETVIGADALLAATMQSMLLDGLLVRQTSSLEDTIAFLAFLHHRILEEMVQKPLSSLSSRAADFAAASYSAVFKSMPALTGPTYTAYALLCGKSGSLTHADYYLRQLLTVRGLSMDKALIILRSLPTPKRLHEYFQDRRLGLQEPNASDPLLSIPNKLGKALMTRLTSIFDDYA